MTSCRFPVAPPNVSSISVGSGYFKSKLDSSGNQRKEASVPDIELVLGISALTGDTSGSYRGLLGLSDEFYRDVFSDYIGLDAFSIVPVLLHPKSRGRVTLKSSDPLDPPIFDINYYDHEHDLRTMVRGIKSVSITSSIIPNASTTFQVFHSHQTRIDLLATISLKQLEERWPSSLRKPFHLEYY